MHEKGRHQRKKRKYLFLPSVWGIPIQRREEEKRRQAPNHEKASTETILLQVCRATPQ